MGKTDETIRIIHHNAYPNNLLMQLGIDVSEVTQDQLAGLDHIISTLSGRDRRIITMRFVEQKTLQEIGNHENCTRERVRQLVSGVIVKISQPENIQYITRGKKKCDEECIAYNARVSFLYNLPITALALSNRSRHALEKFGCKSIGEVISLYEKKQLRSVPNLGTKCLDEITDKIHQYLDILKDGVSDIYAPTGLVDNEVRPCALFLVYGKNKLVYVGTTSMPLRARLYNLFFYEDYRTHLVNINSVSKIEYAMFPSTAEAVKYRDYFIAKYTPKGNASTKTQNQKVDEVAGLPCFVRYPQEQIAKWKKIYSERRNKTA